jgi:hypothetical protein
LNSEAKKTAPASRCLTAFLPLLAVACFFPFSSSAKAQPLANAAAAASIDGFDCVTAYDPPSPWTGSVVARVEEDSALVCDNFPNPWNDLDEISLPLNDKAVIPSRQGQDTPHFTGTTLDPITLRQPGFVPAFLFFAHSSESLPGHIRERAPPSLT